MTTPSRRPNADAWFVMSRDSLEAARKITRGHPRSLMSRVYYSLFCYVHGKLIQAGQSPRKGLGTWSHNSLPGLIVEHLVKPLGSTQAKTLRRAVIRCRDLRGLADYIPGSELDAEVTIDAMRLTERLVRE